MINCKYNILKLDKHKINLIPKYRLIHSKKMMPTIYLYYFCGRYFSSEINQNND